MSIQSPTPQTSSLADLVEIVANNATQQIANESRLVEIQNRINVLTTIGNYQGNGQYVEPVLNSQFLYSSNQNPWTVATKNGSTLAFGSPYNASNITLGSQTVPTVIALKWNSSFILCYTKSNALPLGSAPVSYANSFCNVRYISLDGSLSPSIYSSDCAVPYNTGSNYPNSYQALLSGVAVSSSAFKSIGWCNSVYTTGGGSNWFQATSISKYSFAWDGSNLTSSIDGNYYYYYGQTNTYVPTVASNGYTYSKNYNGLTVNGNGWLSIGTLNCDVNVLDQGTSMGISFSNERYSSPPSYFDYLGNGYVVIPYTGTTQIDQTNRLVITVQEHDAVNGEARCGSYRFTQTTFGTLTALKAFSPSLIFVQWADANNQIQSSVLCYDVTTNILAPYNRMIYNAGYLGVFLDGGLGYATFSKKIMYDLFQISGQSMQLIRISFDETRTLQELKSDSSTNISLTLCSSLSSVTSVIPIGMIQMASDTIIIYGIVTAGGVTNCFVDSFTLS